MLYVIVSIFVEKKLYKMIARTVHAHTPEAQLIKPIFKTYVTKKAHPSAIQI
jgi:hypothetical protein